MKPKLHCLMMDPSFSMVTVQSEDSGIVWETASSRCSTPWASEFNAEPAYPPCTSGTAGRIVFIMDEELMSRRKKKQRSEKTKTLPQVSREILAEAERPAMVEVSVPNVMLAEGAEEHKTADLKEERLFSLVSEGSEILNIIASLKVSTVDEEESKGLEDNLYYLEETPTVKYTEIPDEPELDVHSETEKIPSVIPEPLVSFPYVQVPRRGTTAEDYFEKFTLLDNQAPSGATPVDEAQQQTEEKITEDADNAPDVEPGPGVSSAVSMLDISGEHLDDVFYGGGGEPHSLDTAASVGEKGRVPSKSSLKESGSALFGSEESVLTPIYLPESPQKIIDPNLLEEPKALAFLYSDLYADVIGTRKKKDDDAESVTSEKSFHSQESDSEDRGYLEKFVLKVETQATENDFRRPEERHDPFRLTGFVERHKAEVENQAEELEEITDFFRNSASSSPCEPVERMEREEEIEVVRTPRVTFKEPAPTRTEQRASDPQPFADDAEFSEEFLPVEISEDCPAWEENLPTIVRDAAVKSTSTRIDAPKLKPKPVSDNSQIQAQNTVKPITPRHKPFLDLTPLLPVETEDEKETTEGEKEKENTSSEDAGSSSTKEEGTDCSLSKAIPDM